MIQGPTAYILLIYFHRTSVQPVTTWNNSNLNSPGQAIRFCGMFYCVSSYYKLQIIAMGIIALSV